jgi:hypothetical protein
MRGVRRKTMLRGKGEEDTMEIGFQIGEGPVIA